jgi:hypothetical protein
MIKHSIIVKPEPVIQTTQATWYQNGTAFPEITSQEDLDKWRLNTPFKIGKYVTFGRVMSMHQSRSIYQIVAHVDDYSKLQRQSYHPHNPLVIWKQTIHREPDGIIPQAVADDLRGLNILTDDEVERYVKPYLDSVRNYSTAPA